MKPLFGTLALIILVIVAGVAGCTRPSDANTPTPTPTMVSVTATPPYPVRTLEPGKEVVFNVEKDPASRMITISFKGGTGQAFISEAWGVVTLYKPPNTVTYDDYSISKTLTFPNKDQISTTETLEIQGTQGPDRVEVFVISNGVVYKILEQTLGG